MRVIEAPSIITPERGAEVKETFAGLVERIELAGSLRRGLASTHDVDLVVVPTQAFEAALLGMGATVTRRRARLTFQGVVVDMVFTDDASFGAALLFYTGSKQFNIRCRAKAKARGWKLNEYGLLDVSTDMMVALGEYEILEALGMGYVEPADRR